MPIDIHALCRNLKPERTILLFGAGSSMPSGGPSGPELAEELCRQFNIAYEATLDLSDVATIIEARGLRRPMIDAIRKRISKLKPMGGLLTLPLFDWSSMYTTNYDTLIEQAYVRKDRPINVISSNFEFGDRISSALSLYKLHGTIDKDWTDGHNSRLILSNGDFDQASQYRELLFNRLHDQLGTHSVVIVGHSLSDRDLRSLIDEAHRLKATSGAPGKLFIFVYSKNEDRAVIYESRGFEVCFGGLDELCAALLANAPSRQLVLSVTSDPLDAHPQIHPATVDVSAAIAAQTADLKKLFNGRPASYADICRGWSFTRTIASRLESQLVAGDKRIAYVIGTAGVGKTTGVRQTLSRVVAREIRCFEHKPDFALPVDSWAAVDRELRRRKEAAVLFIDDAHEHIRDINRLAETICSHPASALRLVLASSRPHWNPRLKSAVIFSHGVEYQLSVLDASEINSLLELLDQRQEIVSLVEEQFLGFSRPERRRRLTDRCKADMFVCMKHIFGFQTIDTIILQEFADLSDDYQEIYRSVAAMEHAGVRVHRQLVVRITGLEAHNVARVIDDLDGIIDEYTVSIRDGIYGWSVRHPEIARLISKYKFSSQDDFYDLLDRIISNLNPAYDIETKSIDDMCDISAGIGRITSRSKQNVLLRKMISLTPRLRVPRHRLITNLIRLEQFDAAETEIRVFEKELRADGPVQRYKVQLKLGIADKTPGILPSDRAAIALEAAIEAENALDRFADDKNMYRSFLEAGLQYFRHSGIAEVYDKAMSRAQEAQARVLDPDLQRIISHFDRIGARVMSGT